VSVEQCYLHFPIYLHVFVYVTSDSFCSFTMTFEKPLGLSWVIFGLANITKKSSLSLIILSQSTSFFIFVFPTSLFPADRGAIISQFRVWPFPSITIIAFGERNRNPGYHFAGVKYNLVFLYKQFPSHYLIIY
jgi:hypothetical protein